MAELALFKKERNKSVEILTEADSDGDVTIYAEVKEGENLYKINLLFITRGRVLPYVVTDAAQELLEGYLQFDKGYVQRKGWD